MPKRSTGCDLCRKRKVRCDETKPLCQRCRALGTECPGYSGASTVMFKDQTRMFIERSQPTQTNDLKGPTTTQNKDVAEPERAATPLQPNAATVYSQYERPSISPCDIDSSAATRMNLHATFHDLFIPTSANSLEDQRAHYAYLRMLMTASPGHQALGAALDVVTVGFLATQKRDERLHYEAGKLYDRAIKKLFWALAEPSTRMQDETLAAFSIFANCDHFKGTAMRQSGWIGHIVGIRGLLANRGPASITTPLAWRTFLNNRFQSIVGGLIFRKSAFFDAPDWLALTAEAAKENEFVALTDIMVCLPAWLEAIDNTLDAPEGIDLEMVVFVLQRCMWLLNRLDDWYVELTARQGQQLVQIVDIKTMPDFLELCPDTPFPTVLSFSTVASGFMIVHYFNSKFHLLKNALEVLDQFSQYPAVLLDIQTAVPSLPSTKTLRSQLSKYATLQARSIPFFCTVPCATIGRIQTMQILWFSQDYFGTCAASPDSKESVMHVWCWKMFVVLKNLHIVVHAYHIPRRSNSGGRVQAFSPEDDGSVGLKSLRITKQLGVDLDAPLPQIEMDSSFEELFFG